MCWIHELKISASAIVARLGFAAAGKRLAQREEQSFFTWQQHNPNWIYLQLRGSRCQMIQLSVFPCCFTPNEDVKDIYSSFKHTLNKRKITITVFHRFSRKYNTRNDF